MVRLRRITGMLGSGSGLLDDAVSRVLEEGGRMYRAWQGSTERIRASGGPDDVVNKVTGEGESDMSRAEDRSGAESGSARGKEAVRL
jgi:hypothetical protein